MAGEMDFSSMVDQESIFGGAPGKSAAAATDDKSKTEQRVATSVLDQEAIFAPKETIQEAGKAGDDAGTVADDKKNAGAEKTPSTLDPKAKVAADTTTEENPTLILAKSFKDRGVLQNLDEDLYKKTLAETGDEVEALQAVFQDDLNYREAKLKESHEAKLKGYSKYVDMLEKGLDPDEAAQITYFKERYNSINDENIVADANLRGEILYSYYKEKTQLSDAEIQEAIAEKVALGKDTELAKAALPQILQAIDSREKFIVQAKDKERQESAQKLEQSKQELRNKINGLEEFLGHKFASKTKDKLYEMIVNPVTKDDKGNQYNEMWTEFNKDPNGFQMKWAAIRELGVWDNKLDRISQKAKTEAINSIQSAVAKMTAEGVRKAGMDIKDTPSGDRMKEVEKNLLALQRQRKGGS